MDVLKPTREGLEAARERGDRASVIDVAGSTYGTARYAQQILQEWDRATQAALREQDRRENDRRHRQTMRVAWAAAGISIVSMVIAIISVVIASPACLG
jgi:Flp pilus assembly protein TadB